jgi:hypothetical protein
MILPLVDIVPPKLIKFKENIVLALPTANSIRFVSGAKMDMLGVCKVALRISSAISEPRNV